MRAMRVFRDASDTLAERVITIRDMRHSMYLRMEGIPSDVWPATGRWTGTLDEAVAALEGRRPA